MSSEKNRRNRFVVSSSGCRSLQFVPGFSSPAFNSSSLGNNNSSSDGPFRGLVICVTGLSKEARTQVQDATERMGGQYSPDLHPQCTHLVVQSCAGRKFDHALKHGVKRGLSVVTLAWFINSAKLNARLDESSYSVSKGGPKNFSGSPDNRLLETSGEQACLPSRIEDTRSFSPVKSQGDSPAEQKPGPLLKNYRIYLDPGLSEDMQAKVVAAASKEGATFTENWFTGSNATHIVCEKDSFLTYTGSSCNLVTPLWLLKSLKEHSLQRLVQLSADLARHLAFAVDPSNTRSTRQIEDNDDCERSLRLSTSSRLQSERQESVRVAKEGVRKRRGQRKQPCRTLPRPITPVTLLESVCWSVSDPPSAARLYVDRSPESLLQNEFFDAYENENGNTSGSESEVFTRPLRESERLEIVYSGVFLTVLFPVDRFAEMGPSSRSFFSSNGFTRQQILELVYEFYQEGLTEEEIGVAINTDSKHADKLRALYSGAGDGEISSMKRCEFIGSRRSFEGLKRLSRENTGQVYELWVGA